MSLTIYKRATLIYSTRAGFVSAPKAAHYRGELTNYVIRAESTAEAKTESAIR